MSFRPKFVAIFTAHKYLTAHTVYSAHELTKQEKNINVSIEILPVADGTSGSYQTVLFTLERVRIEISSYLFLNALQ